MNFGGRREAIKDLTRDGGAVSAGHSPRVRSWPSRASVAGAVAALLVLLAVAGCGSSSSNTPAANSTFVAEANGACRTAYAKVNALRPAVAGQETAKEVATNLPKIAVIAQAMLGRLTALTPPASQQAEYNKMVSAWRNEISLALVRGQALKAGDKKRLDAAQSQLVTLAKEFDSAATKVGLSVCAATP